MKSSNTSERLRYLMRMRNLKQSDILSMSKPYCVKYNIKLNKNDLSQYVNGKVEPGQFKLSILGMTLDVSEAWLMGYDVPMERPVYTDSLPDNIIHLPKTKRIPLIGSIACGTPILAEQNIEKMLDISDGVEADFALICKGESMINARINDGDVVYIRSQPTVDNGEIAAVLIGDEATLKRVTYFQDKNLFILKAENPKFEDMIFSGSELDEIKILGKAVYFLSAVR